MCVFHEYTKLCIYTRTTQITHYTQIHEAGREKKKEKFPIFIIIEKLSVYSKIIDFYFMYNGRMKIYVRDE